ncbi:MAG: hypothetical protein IJS57_01670 [Paludibacteraceae bacterium]|nr:hypothetical protein [Paludibacteraceae bacterium]
MRKIIGILVCLWVAARLFAVDYQPFAYSAPTTEFRSTSTYSVPQTANSLSTTHTGLTSSLAAISTSNFQMLNSEGGLCYQPSATANRARKGRPTEDEGGDGDNAIGEYDLHSPVGETPFILFVLLAALYIGWRRMAKEKE